MSLEARIALVEDKEQAVKLKEEIAQARPSNTRSGQ